MHEEMINDVSQQKHLNISDYPIISLEIKLKNNKNGIIPGLYRTWGANQEK